MQKRFLLFAALIMTILIAPACTPQNTTHPAAEDNAFDRQFIEMMVPHHEAALGMAEIAQERAEHAEVKEMADAIIAGQSAEIDQMLGWLEAWYGTRDTPPMDKMPMLSGMAEMGHGSNAMDMAADVKALRNAPEPFDLAFIDYMIVHHESALEAGEAALKQASREEIKTMAAAILDVQQKEIDQLKAWREAWYPGQP
jgi:uncharacterized protein (DUF305 family)